jgi:hypothetical protein
MALFLFVIFFVLPAILCEYENGELGTDVLAQLAVHTFLGPVCYREVISLLIEIVREVEDLPGAIFCTETAPLASALQNVDFSNRFLDFFDV